VSVAVEVVGERGQAQVIREVVKPLVAWNADLRSNATLPPGSILSGCRIETNRIAHPESGVEPYVMEFLWSGRLYLCPLFRFQPRTRSLDPQTVDAVAI